MATNREVLEAAQLIRNQLRGDPVATELYQKHELFRRILRWLGFDDPELTSAGHFLLWSVWSLALVSGKSTHNFRIVLLHNGMPVRAWDRKPSVKYGPILAEMLDYIEYMEEGIDDTDE